MAVDNLAVAEAYAAATRAGDIETLTGIVHPDVRVWHNYDQAEIGRDQVFASLGWLHRTVPDIDWSDEVITPTPAGFVWQAIITGTAPGGSLSAPTCVVFTLDDDGRITRVEEYLDPAGLTALRS